MYAVLSSGGKQYRVEAGTTLMLERLDGEPGVAGSQVTFDRVLLIGDGDDVTIGTPTVAGASVSATVASVRQSRQCAASVSARPGTACTPAR